jgi:chemotaxis methyl-accepting protein methylase
MSSGLDRVLEELNRQRSVDLSGYRRAMLERRLAARMATNRVTDASAYLDRLRRDPDEVDRLLAAFSVGVSRFFRDPRVWEVLADAVLPLIIDRHRATRGKEIRVWSAGCSTGEEAYSLAILFHEALRGELAAWKVHIFATDLNEEALRTAARGVYPREQLACARLGVVDSCFTGHDGKYEVRPFLRRMVWFSRDDLTSRERLAPAESVFGSFDLVCCRNVLIYFAPALQQWVVDKLVRAMAPGGFLVTGEAERLHDENRIGLTHVDRRNRIYRKTPDRAARSGQPTRS